MNTMVKIRSCNRRSATGKNRYNLTRLKDGEADIFVIEENDFPPAKKTLSSEQKKQIHALQKTISKCEKRLTKAIEENKKKSIETNKKNIAVAKKKLAKFEGRGDGREKHFVEFTVALTNSYFEDISEDWAEKTVGYFKLKYPEISIISAVWHRDQNSPHMHILAHSEDVPITQYLAQSNGFTDTSRESMKMAYSKIAHDYHDWAQEGVVEEGVRLDPLVKGRRYVSLGQFKVRGNFEVKLKEREKEDERRNEETDRRARVGGVRSRIDAIYAEIEELDAEVSEAVGLQGAIEQCGARLTGATDTLGRLADSIERLGGLIERLGGGRTGILSEEEEHKMLMADVLARNAQERAKNRSKRQNPDQTIGKVPKP